MNNVVLGFIGMWETVAILAVVLVLFGAKKASRTSPRLGDWHQGVPQSHREVNEDLQKAFEEEPARPQENRHAHLSAG